MVQKAPERMRGLIQIPEWRGDRFVLLIRCQNAIILYQAMRLEKRCDYLHRKKHKSLFSGSGGIRGEGINLGVLRRCLLVLDAQV